MALGTSAPKAKTAFAPGLLPPPTLTPPTYPHPDIYYRTLGCMRLDFFGAFLFDSCIFGTPETGALGSRLVRLTVGPALFSLITHLNYKRISVNFTKTRVLNIQALM